MKVAFSKLLQLGSVVGGTFVAALFLPENWKLWGSVVSAAAGVVALMLVTICVKAQKRILAAFILTSAVVVGLILGLVCFNFASKAVVIVNGRPFVKGTLLPKADAYIKDHKISEAAYLKGSAYQPDDVWTADSIGKNSATLLTLFSAFNFLLAFGILGALELTPQLNPEPENWFLKVLPWGLVIVVVGIAILFAYLWLYVPRATALNQFRPSVGRYVLWQDYRRRSARPKSTARMNPPSVSA